MSCLVSPEEFAEWARSRDSRIAGLASCWASVIGTMVYEMNFPLEGAIESSITPIRGAPWAATLDELDAAAEGVAIGYFGNAFVRAWSNIRIDLIMRADTEIPPVVRDVT